MVKMSTHEQTYSISTLAFLQMSKVKTNKRENSSVRNLEKRLGSKYGVEAIWQMPNIGSFHLQLPVLSILSQTFRISSMHVRNLLCRYVGSLIRQIIIILRLDSPYIQGLANEKRHSVKPFTFLIWNFLSRSTISYLLL